MDNINYLAQIDRISRWKTEIFKIMEFQLKTNSSPSLTETINYRASIMNDNDRNIASAYLDLDLFSDYDNDFRASCICVCLEAEFHRKLNNEIKRCSKYEGNEPIFENPHIRESRKGDLIDYRVFSREPLSNIFKIGDSWGYFDSRIPAQIYEWIDNCFSDKPCRIRVEPDNIFDKRPPQMLIECMIIPPPFQWWKTLKIYRGHTKGSAYQLLGDNCKNNYKDYYDYHFLNVRRLDVSETRNDNNYISMMIEELEENKDNLNQGYKYVVGRMIHLDSNAKIGMNFKDATLSHIDLAFNLYINESADTRLGQYLANGKTILANYRTHILRLENIPFVSLFKIAYSFFKSKTLTSEWLSNEFTE